MLKNKNDKSLEGVVLVDKPSGMTSHDVVSRIRRYLGIKRVGHAGTLDPMATGLLIILVGRATKISQYLMSMDKGYTGNVYLGQETNTQDKDGEVVAEAPVPEGLDAEKIQALLDTFYGDQYQTPPMFSAKKVNGMPLYKAARKGQVVEREARLIRISRFELGDLNLPEFTFGVECTKGTYVRTLAHDFGQKLGCGAHLSALRRTRIGPFSVLDAHPLDSFEKLTHAEWSERLIPAIQAVPSQVL